jgi:hypothetical protein
VIIDLYNLNFIPKSLGYKVEEKLHLEVREPKKVRISPVKIISHHFSTVTYVCKSNMKQTMVYVHECMLSGDMCMLCHSHVIAIFKYLGFRVSE